MKRITHFSFYNPYGIIDPDVVFFLKELSLHSESIFFSSNGDLCENEIKKIVNIVEKVIIRKNEGLDAQAHREFIDNIGYNVLENYDELLLLNHTCFGPIFPFSELFSEMDNRDCDIWGVMAHKEMIPNPFTGKGTMPFHINANFIALRKAILQSGAFKDYWKGFPKISSYNDAVFLHESQFTKYFTDKGFKVSTYVDGDQYGSRYPGMFDIDETIRNRNPLLKRRAFFHEPRYLDSEGVDLPRALRLIESNSDYDLNLIWANIARSGEPRYINTNAALTFALPNFTDGKPLNGSIGRIALCAHVYYVDMMDEVISYARNIPAPFDMIITTDTREKGDEIRRICSDKFNSGDVIVRIMEENRGRDMAALYITCRDIFLTDKYDLVCRIHTKKSPQVIATKGNLFKRHLLDNLLYSKGYVENIIKLFERNRHLGVAVPPLVNISYNHFGHAWYNNRENVNRLSNELNLRAHIDSETPIAIFGTMFWFRPKALRKLFLRDWSWSEFNKEPDHVDGSLAHALERLTCYVAQDAGYLTYQIMTTDYAGQNYASLEYKFQKLLSYLPLAEFNQHCLLLESWKQAGYPMVGAGHYAAPTVTMAFDGLLHAIGRSINFRSPRLANRLRPIYHFARARLRAVMG
ncbi:MAG TPA: rhamnan synthesis F family protein [Rhizobiaceae bacterium]|nr:rhamnan synthesis F family protein [Rhizobiaceae bacterium]